MNSTIIISLILPCYNVEEFIGVCLNTVFNQDIPEEKYEVICVDDCSNDGTIEIIRTFQKQHPNLILIHQTNNQKQAAARNEGLRKASGKYVWFIDSDDYIVENCLSNIVHELEVNQLEVLQFNVDVTDKINYQSVLDVNIKADTEVITGGDYLNFLMQNCWGRTIEVWRRVFDREFLMSNNLFFPEYVFGTEDMLFFYQSIVKCKFYKQINSIYYIYRVDNKDSVSNSPNTKGLKLADKIIANADIIKFFKEEQFNKDKKFIKAAIKSYKWSLKIYIRKIFTLDKSELDIFLEKIEKHKDLISQQLGFLQIVLLSNPLLIKVINTIFVSIYNFRFKKKVNNDFPSY